MPLNILFSEENYDHLRPLIKKGLLAFNHPFLGEWNDQTFTIYAEDKNKEIIGGICGSYANAHMKIEWVWIDEQYRSQGLGRKIFHHLDEFALAKNCKYIDLETLEFQAKDFYQKLGFNLIATLPNWCAGYDSYIMRKFL